MEVNECSKALTETDCLDLSTLFLLPKGIVSNKYQCFMEQALEKKSHAFLNGDSD
jgi:hypothetical protein